MLQKDAYYFPHDSNAKDDPKCMMLIEQLGLEGYGIFWVLIETLRDQPNYSYPLSLLPAIARRFNTTHEKIKAVVHSYKLFEVTQDEFFYSHSLLQRMEVLDSKRDMQRQKALKRHYPAVALPGECNGNASKEKESKEKESKEKYIILNNNIDEIYNLYPGKCPIANRPTGKCTKDKTKIKTLLDSHSVEELIEIIRLYIDGCIKSKSYVKNFATFLNNLPDIKALNETQLNTQKSYMQLAEEMAQRQRNSDLGVIP